MELLPSSPDVPPPGASPRWSSTLKLVIGLTSVAIIAALVVRFRVIIGPLILSLMLAYLLHPVAVFLSCKFHASWRVSVGIVFLIVVIVIGGLITLVGFALVQQIQSLIGVFQRFFAELPQLVADLSSQVYTIGPFQIDLSQYDLNSLVNELLSTVQGVLGRLGGIVSTVASGTAQVFGWIFFILITSYFLLTESGQVRENIVRIEIPGYDADARRLGSALTNIWNVYLRSQFIIFVLVVVAYYLLMTILGMGFTFGIALMAGLARFVPYLGPTVTWITAALVSYFSPTTPFGLEPWVYTLLVVGLAVLLDQAFDQYIQPRLMGSALGVHPAAILVAALVAYQLLGLIGLVLAAPVLASVNLIGRYIFRKMFDLNPWPESDKTERRPKAPPERFLHRLRAWIRLRTRR